MCRTISNIIFRSFLTSKQQFNFQFNSEIEMQVKTELWIGAYFMLKITIGLVKFWNSGILKAEPIETRNIPETMQVSLPSSHLQSRIQWIYFQSDS